MEASSSAPPVSVSTILRLDRLAVALAAASLRRGHFFKWRTEARVAEAGVWLVVQPHSHL